MIKELVTKAKKMVEPVLREGATALDKAKHSVLKNKYARYAKMKAKKMVEPVLREGATALDKAKHAVLKSKYASQVKDAVSKNKYARYAKMKVNKHPGKFGIGGGYLAAKMSEDDNMEE